MEYLIAIAFGVLVGYFIARAQSASASQQAAPPAAAAAPAVRLHELTTALDAIGESSSHPRDLEHNATFREAVAIFESAEVPVKVVTDYALGANWMLATAAIAALCARSDREDASTPLLTAFPHIRPWPMYYALRYFNSLDTRPPVGAVVLRAPEWWGDHPFIPALLMEHFTARLEKGDAVSFGDTLTRATRAELRDAETVLRKIDHNTARELLSELNTVRRSTLDRDFLQAFGRFIDADDERKLLVEHDAITDQLGQAEASILHQQPRSLLVVGEHRSGKSSFLALLSQRLTTSGWTTFQAGAAEVMSGQEYIGQLEERLRRIATELAAEKRVIWYVPDLLQMATSGTHKGQSASILDQVMPAIAAGRVVLVSEATPAALTKLLQVRPALRAALEIIRLRSLSDAEINDLAGKLQSRLSQYVSIEFEPDVLSTAGYLARHYLGSTQMPGAVLDLLKLTAQHVTAHDGSRVERRDLLATMSQLTGMPQQVLDDRERVDLALLRKFFSTRVIGQDEAVETIVDRIAMLKAGLTDPNRPTGVFLFAGPTGTGKTELAKSLAEFLFGSADRLIRLDMSEFQGVESLRKIIGEPDSQDETQALVHRVRRQPFSVVLLDEFEKAHPNAWDLFLQVFDDGRLTDAHGYTVDFRHCIIILTSNLGSTIKQDAGPGFRSAAGRFSQEQVTKAINQSFRPEFVNRLDRIIVFRPLTREHMRSIVVKELARVLERRGLRHREWAVEWEVSALEFLLDRGFSPAMGARPLKRAIDQHLLAPLAAALVEHRFPEGDQFLFVRSDGRALQVEFVDPDVPDSATPRAAPEPEVATADGNVTLARMILQPSGGAPERRALLAELRRNNERLADERWLALEQELVAKMSDRDFWSQPGRQAVLSRFEVMDRVKAAAGTARALAERLERSAGASGRYSRELVSRLAAQLFAVSNGIEDVLTDAPVEVVLAVQSVLDRAQDVRFSAEWRDRLVDMYRKWAVLRGMQLVELTDAAQTQPLLVISGFGVARLIDGEAGLHVLEHDDPEDPRRAVARVIVKATPALLPDDASAQHAMLAADIDKGSAPATIVRRYRLEPSPLVRDLRRGWRTGRAELVFMGHFDLIGDVSAAHTT